MGFQQDFRENVPQKVFHEIDAGYHEHEQQDDRKVRGNLFVDGYRIGHPEQNGFDGKKPTRWKRIAFEGHRQGEDEFTYE